MADKYGWIKLYRSLQDNEIWQSNEPYDMRAAWVDLLLLVNHEDGNIIDGRTAIKIERGQHKTSYSKLAKRWHWSRDRVKRYFALLQKLKMATTYTTTNGVTVTIENYAFFQDSLSTNKSTDKSANKSTSKSTNKSTSNTQTRSKEDKKNKEDKNIYSGPGGPRDSSKDDDWQ